LVEDRVLPLPAEEARFFRTRVSRASEEHQTCGRTRGKNLWKNQNTEFFEEPEEPRFFQRFFEESLKEEPKRVKKGLKEDPPVFHGCSSKNPEQPSYEKERISSNKKRSSFVQKGKLHDFRYKIFDFFGKSLEQEGG
jgi:hypothetical protein